MAEISALEKAGALQGVKVPSAHDPMQWGLLPHSRASRGWGVNVTLSQQIPQISWQQLPLKPPSAHQSKECLYTGLDAESCSHLQPHQITPAGRFCCASHQSPGSEKDVLVAPRKWIKVPLDSITSPISALAWRHELQLIMWAMFLLYYKKQLCNQTSALLFGRSIWLLSLGYSRVVHGEGSKSVMDVVERHDADRNLFCSLLQVLTSPDFKYGTHALSPSTCVFTLASLNACP